MKQIRLFWPLSSSICNMPMGRQRMTALGTMSAGDKHKVICLRMAQRHTVSKAAQ